MRRVSGDAGLTLVELLAATAITALIAPVLTGALVVGWRTTDDTVERLGPNRDRLLVPSLLTRDVQSAEAVQTSGATCHTAGRLARRPVLVDRDGRHRAALVDRAASWVQTPGTPSYLERRYCADGTAVTSSASASHDAAGATVTCRAVAGGPAGPCAPATVVELTVTDTAGASYAALGRRRAT